MNVMATEVEATEGVTGFKHEQWEITRGLKRTSDTPHLDRTEQYLDVLPTYKGKDLLAILSEKTTEGKMVRILDIGCGAGLADLDLRKLYSPEQLDIQTIGHPQDTRVYISDVSRGITRGPTEQDLKDNQIGFNFIDFSQLSADNIAKLGRFDVIVASYSLEWLSHDPKHPELNEAGERKSVANVNGLLKPQGIALISPFDQSKNYEVANLEKNHFGISFSKE
jgi:SAM-dependent methyltransferase